MGGRCVLVYMNTLFLLIGISNTIFNTLGPRRLMKGKVVILFSSFIIDPFSFLTLLNPPLGLNDLQ